MFTQSCEKGPGNGTILTNGKGISQIPFHTDRHSKEKRNRRLKQACTGKDGELAGERGGHARSPTNSPSLPVHACFSV